MKVAVYAIAKDEERFVARWAASCSDADYRLILDTGSTDRTFFAAVDAGVEVRERMFDPWRFDVARNASLRMLPQDADMCIALDMDEVLQPGWRDHLERAWESGATRPRYRYVWSWEGSKPGLVYGGDKIHARHGYAWKHPVHEVLCADGIVERQCWTGLEIHHHPDKGKSRGQYLPLLRLAVEEDPLDDRNCHYLARELLFAGLNVEAEEMFRRHLGLELAVWKPERAASMRYLYKLTGEVSWLEAAVAECPDRREGWVDLARHQYEVGDWHGCLRSATAALRIAERPLEYLTESFAWGALPHDLAAIAAYRCGYGAQAAFHGMAALRIDPYDGRLAANMRFYAAA